MHEVALAASGRADLATCASQRGSTSSDAAAAVHPAETSRWGAWVREDIIIVLRRSKLHDCQLFWGDVAKVFVAMESMRISGG